MKISLNKEEYSKFAELLHVKEQNICAAEIYNEYLLNHYNDITSAKDENDFFAKFLDVLEIAKNDKDFSKINKVCHLDKISKLSVEDFQKDPYFQAIKNINAKEGNWQFLRLQYNAFEGFVSDELIIDPKIYSEHTPLSYFEKDFVYPAVIENDSIWMSIIPHEINTMKEHIKAAHGRVLVLGLGLGYYLYHISNKKDVSEIDVIEIDQRVISLFNKHLKDKFPNIKKINIINEDGIKYLKNNKKKYDYIFSDIWHNVGDGEELYLKIKPFENIYKNTEFSYWIETSILAMLRRQTLTVIEEQLNDLKEEEYLKARNINDEIINRIYFYLKNATIDSYDKLHVLLSDNSLKEMAKHLFKV